MTPQIQASVLALILQISLQTPGLALAQESRLASQALHCSAVMSVVQDVASDDPTLHARLGQAVRVFSEVHAQEMGASPDTAMHQLQPRREALRQSFRGQWAERAAYFREDAVVCGAWAEGFLAQGERYSHVPVYPKVVAADVRAKYQALAQTALDRWNR